MVEVSPEQRVGWPHALGPLYTASDQQQCLSYRLLVRPAAGLLKCQCPEHHSEVSGCTG